MSKEKYLCIFLPQMEDTEFPSNIFHNTHNFDNLSFKGGKKLFKSWAASILFHSLTVDFSVM